jgi:hypothetical protein
MTNREMFLLATSILFASTTAGMALQTVMHPRPPMERGFDGPHGPDGKRPDFFAMSDANKDGFVTKDEMMAKQQARTDELFTTVDTDHDGKLTKEEMENGRELMRAKFKARMEAEAKAAGQPGASAPQPEAK